MIHASKTDLIRLLAGELSDGQREALEAHLATCPDCRSVHASYRQVHGALGDWPDEPVPDLVARVEATLAARRRAALLAGWRRLRRPARIAAAALLGVGGGYAAGRLSAGAAGERGPAWPAAGEDEAMAAVGAVWLAVPTATGLPAAVFASDEAWERGMES